MVENWTDRNIHHFNTERCQVLHLGVDKPKQQYRLKASQLRSSLAERT